jgi:uncharacterized protein YbjQ (UPF0145 family)
MPEFLKSLLELTPLRDLDETSQLLSLAAIALAVLFLVLWFYRRLRQAAEAARHRAQLRRTRAAVEERTQELTRQAAHIIATSSTGEVVGYRIIRQIEAVFTDGHKTAAIAVEAVKALAARKGANAVINLRSDRLTTNTYAAHGDAVVVRALDAPPPLESPPGPAPESHH